MFYCEIGSHLSKPRERRYLVVIEVRKVANLHTSHHTTGYEIVREVSACQACLPATPPAAVEVDYKTVAHPGVKGVKTGEVLDPGAAGLKRAPYPPKAVR